MAKVIALFNQCGGVGKSTLTLNLGYHLAQQHKVLLIDMDPQSSLTDFMGVDPVLLDKTMYDVIINEESLPIYKNIHGMDLAPTNITLSSAEMELVNAHLRDFRLSKPIQLINKNYDFILIDCLPNLGFLSYICLVASTHVLVPVQTQYKALFGTQWLLTTILRIQNKVNPKLKLVGFIPNQYDKRNLQDREILKQIKGQLSEYGKIFPPVIRTTAFPDSSQAHAPLGVYAPKNPALRTLESIAQFLID